MTAPGAPAIRAELSRRFGAREALAAATLEVAAGTVHALVGENGAGKTTLVKIVAGVLAADRGTLAVDGRAVALARWNRHAARAAGIGIVQQHGASAGTLSVVENAVLGAEPRRGPLLDLAPTARALAELGARVGLPIDPEARAGAQALGAAQRAEIVAALHHGARLLILDEPTAVLTPPEVDGLLATLRALAAEGKAIVIVTHKLDEVRAVADAVTVLRAGRTVATFASAGDVGAIARAIIGGGEAGEAAQATAAVLGAAVAGSGDGERSAVAVGGDGDGERSAVAVGGGGGGGAGGGGGGDDGGDAGGGGHGDGDGVALALDGVSVGRELVDVSLVVRRGERVGVAGVDGNGQRELALAIAGLARATGRVRLGERDVTRASVARRLAAGLAHIPEDRLHGGLVLDASVADNLALGRADVTGRWRIDRAAVRRHAEARIAELDIRPPDPDAIARALSGGNQQKLVVGRELSRPGVVAVVAAQPTRGVDLGAVARIHDRLRAVAAGGAGVLVISADLDELLALCDRIVVLLRGRLVGELAGDALRGPGARAAFGAMMTGVQPAAVASGEAAR